MSNSPATTINISGSTSVLKETKDLTLFGNGERGNGERGNGERGNGDRDICIHYDVAELREDIQHLTAKGWLRTEN